MQHESTSINGARRRVAMALEYPIELQGGVSVLVRGLLREFRSCYEVYLVSPDTAEQAAASTVGDCIAGHVAWNPRKAGRRTAGDLAAELSRLRIDTAHFHFGGNFGWGSRQIGSTPVAYAARRGVCVFTTVHSVVGLLAGYCGPEKPLWFKLALLPMAWMGKMHLLSHVKKEIAASEHDLALLRRWYRPFARKFTQIYHSRISDADSAVPVAREELIVNVGHIGFRKGQATLVEAFGKIAGRHQRWRLALVGPVVEPAAEEKIRRLIHEQGLGERVTLVGSVADPGPWHARASIYVQPSLEEALGLALQEAMFHGCPCVGTTVGGIPELIAPGTGILVPPNDASALAGQLDALITDAAARQILGRRAAESIRKRGMTRNAMAAQHISLYEGDW